MALCRLLMSAELSYELINFKIGASEIEYILEYMPINVSMYLFTRFTASIFALIFVVATIELKVDIVVLLNITYTYIIYTYVCI